jgi:hypothetical protein
VKFEDVADDGHFKASADAPDDPPALRRAA